MDRQYRSGKIFDRNYAAPYSFNQAPVLYLYLHLLIRYCTTYAALFFVIGWILDDFDFLVRKVGVRVKVCCNSSLFYVLNVYFSHE